MPPGPASALAALLPLLLVAHAAAPQCAGGEIYDSGPQESGTACIASEMLSTGPELAGWAQLFQPRTIPWLYTAVCFWLDTAAVAGGVDVTVALREAEINGDPYVLLASRTVRVDTPGGAWTSVAVHFEVTKPFAFVTVEHTAGACNVTMGVTNDGPVRPGHHTTGWWNANSVDGRYDDYAALCIRAKGEPLPRDNATLARWTCDRAAFMDGRTCDCGCGLWDPDCSAAAAGPLSPNCSAGEVCIHMAFCERAEWNSTSALCNATHFGAFDGCQCECGGPWRDPDCAFPSAVSHCQAEGLAAPHCSLKTRGCADAWTCDAALYHDGVCHCDCGAVDPDCPSIASSPSPDCAGTACSYGSCIADAQWTCRVLYWNNSDGCDCMCGAYDPDCEMEGGVLGCQGPQVCNYSGECILPRCGDRYVERTEECDGGTGCTADCTCDATHVPHSAGGRRDTNCAPSCGNGVVDRGKAEQCDGGEGCTASCTCGAGYHHASGACQVDAQGTRRRGRRDPRPANVPVDVDSGLQFVDAGSLDVPPPSSAALSDVPPSACMAPPSIAMSAAGRAASCDSSAAAAPQPLLPAGPPRYRRIETFCDSAGRPIQTNVLTFDQSGNLVAALENVATPQQDCVDPSSAYRSSSSSS
eukprot:m51a1_g6124 putative serine-threonine protein (641) ;mRNA; r:173019-175763